jgi:hypothetical protein
MRRSPMHDRARCPMLWTMPRWAQVCGDARRHRAHVAGAGAAARPRRSGASRVRCASDLGVERMATRMHGDWLVL